MFFYFLKEILNKDGVESAYKAILRQFSKRPGVHRACQIGDEGLENPQKNCSDRTVSAVSLMMCIRSIGYKQFVTSLWYVMLSVGRLRQSFGCHNRNFVQCQSSYIVRYNNENVRQW
jgi:hypothetical protein